MGWVGKWVREGLERRGGMITWETRLTKIRSITAARQLQSRVQWATAHLERIGTGDDLHEFLGDLCLAGAVHLPLEGALKRIASGQLSSGEMKAWREARAAITPR